LKPWTWGWLSREMTMATSLILHLYRAFEEKNENEKG